MSAAGVSPSSSESDPELDAESELELELPVLSSGTGAPGAVSPIFWVFFVRGGMVIVLLVE